MFAWRLYLSAAGTVYFLAHMAGCEGALNSNDEAILRRDVNAAISREIAGLEKEPSAAAPPATTPRMGDGVIAALESRLDELNALSPAVGALRTDLDLGPDLLGQQSALVAVTLDGVVRSALARNLGAAESRLEPAINAADVIAAEAAFDFTVFANVDLRKIDEPSTVPVLGGIPLGAPVDANEQYRFETGVRKRFTPGTQVTVSGDLTRFQTNTPGFALSPDPAYTSAMRLGVTQPLLRNFGTDVNTATIRLAGNAQRRAEHEVRRTLLDVALAAELSYWDLTQAWRELAIAQWLVEEGVKVRDVLERRREFDTRQAQFADAVARVEQRSADVIRARRTVRAASDRLKRIINDPELSMADEAALAPSDDLSAAPINVNLREAALTALDQRPELHAAALRIDDATIRRRVADNARLPLLDVSARMDLLGLDDDAGGSMGNTLDGDFIDYILGLAFEAPLGNREADALARQARLRRSSAFLAYRRTAQDVILEVKAALRDVVTNLELIRATRSFRVAQAENLRALLVEEETLAGLTPEFLNLKFTRQETLAQARRDEVAALVNFDKAVAELYRAMGTTLAMKGVRVDADDMPALPRLEDVPLGDTDWVWLDGMENDRGAADDATHP